jgi:hypothetical protein
MREMTEIVQRFDAASQKPVASFLEIVGPAYRRDALAELARVHELSAACHAVLSSDPLNISGVEALTEAIAESWHRYGTAIAGMGAAISCRGSA